MSSSCPSREPFVESSENQLGIGRLLAVNGDRCGAQYFRSPADTEMLGRTVSKASLKRVKLAEATRAYHHSPDEHLWKVGRLLAYHPDGDACFVGFSNVKKQLISSDALLVRCGLPISNIVDQLNQTILLRGTRCHYVGRQQKQHINKTGQQNEAYLVERPGIVPKITQVIELRNR